MRKRGQLAGAFTRRGAVYIIPCGTESVKYIGSMVDLPMVNVHHATPARTREAVVDLNV
jgi:hypothetical protein